MTDGNRQEIDMEENADETSMDSSQSIHNDAVLRDEANFIQNMSQFFNQEALHDVILKVAGQEFFGHRFVLAKSSDVFRTLLYEKSWAEDQSKEIELSESAECQAVFSHFLRYLYTAEVVISRQSAVGILCLADKYNVTSLKDLCVGYMIENAKSPNVSNALMWYPWAKALHLESLLRQCMRTIAWNYYEILMSPDWLHMDIEFLHDLLQSSELVVPNEFTLWEALSRWLLQDSCLPQLQENTHRLLPLVRFPQMLVSQLHLLEHSDLAQNDCCKDLLHELLSQAYRFRALCPSQGTLEPIVSFTDPYYLPREYTDLTVDKVRMQNTLRFGIQVDVKMYKGPVPQENREADWKITYRKQGDLWQIQLYCHETGLVNNEAHIQPTILFTTEAGKVIQVHREIHLVVPRGTTMNIQTTVENPPEAKIMSVLIKPIPT